MAENYPLGANLRSDAPWNEKEQQGYRCPECSSEDILIESNYGQCKDCMLEAHITWFEDCYEDYHNWEEEVDE